MAKKQKLELTWIGKEERPRLEPRILLEDKNVSYHAAHRTSDKDIFDNILIKGDNLLALKALEQDFTGKIKCIYIDPPYNTGSAFAHYDDGIEHSLWLSLIRDRLEILRKLLSQDGSIWISIDDTESHYLKVLCDEIFGRANFVANVIWQKKYAPANDAKWLSDSHDHILVFAKNKENWRPNKLTRSEEANATYKNPDNDSRGVWASDNYTCNKNADERPNLYYSVINPNTKEEIYPSKTAVWRYSKERHLENEKNGLVWWGKNGTNSTPRYKRFLSQIDSGVVAQTILSWQEVGHTQDGKREQLALHPENPFATPKPEKLLQRILQLATKEGDLVLDSFAGSGTTGAVAHKMRRRWVMVELGEHCSTHIVPRLKKVINGEDSGGITKAVDWKGGGGFRFFELAPSLLKKDKWGNYIINPEYNAEMLAEAVCKHEGFNYAPSESIFWMHGKSSENSYIYVTTQQLSRETLQLISEDVGSERCLTICCKAFRAEPDEFENLDVKKIPKYMINHCDWERDDYSLQISNLSLATTVESTDNPIPKTVVKEKSAKTIETPLFPLEAESEKSI